MRELSVSFLKMCDGPVSFVNVLTKKLFYCQSDKANKQTWSVGPSILGVRLIGG